MPPALAEALSKNMVISISWNVWKNIFYTFQHVEARLSGWWSPIPINMKATKSTMTSSNIFCVTGHLCGEFTGHWWIPSTKASDVELWCFLWSAWINGWVNHHEVGDLWRHSAHYDVTVMRSVVVWNKHAFNHAHQEVPGKVVPCISPGFDIHSSPVKEKCIHSCGAWNPFCKFVSWVPGWLVSVTNRVQGLHTLRTYRIFGKRFQL